MLNFQVVWFTALFPYAVLLILLVRGITLPGSATGIQYYLSPNFEAITQPQVNKLIKIYRKLFEYNIRNRYTAYLTNIFIYNDLYKDKMIALCARALKIRLQLL